MRHQHEAILLLMCCFQAGCMSLDSFTVWPNRDSDNWSVEQSPARQFDLNDSAERQAALARIDRESMRVVIANARLGSSVAISDEFGHQFHGTLFQKGPHSVEVMNCICKEVVPGPDGENQCKTSHVPFQSFTISNLLGFTYFDSPSKLIAAERIRYHSRDITVEALIFMSGRRLSLIEPHAPVESVHDANSSEEIQKEIAATARGSLVWIVDELDQRFNGILLSTSPERVELMNCVWRETVPRPNGQAQFKTNYVPFQSFKTSSIRSYGIVCPPPPELDVSELGKDSHELCIDEFVYLSDRR